jgi:hypothetical protein
MSETTKKPENQGCLIGCGAFILLIAIFGLIGSIGSLQEQNLTPEQKAEREKEKVNDWYANTSEYSCESNLKDKLRDPNSYEKDGDFTTPTDDGNNKIITWKFRAKNGFGGYNAGIGMCYVGKENGGTVRTEVIGQ